MKSLNPDSQSIFISKDYRKFLLDQIESSPNAGRGVRARLADAIGCQLPFITHVLAGRNEFSPEHAEAAARFFGLSNDETEYFLLLVSFNRAGTSELRAVLEKLLAKVAERNLLLKRRLKIEDTLTSEDQVRYYSHWLYSATHMALTVPALRDRAKLAERFRVSDELMVEILDFLVKRGFAVKNGKSFEPRRMSLHLEKSAPALLNHHANWRNKAVESLPYERPSDLHYSAALSCSKKDLPKVREKIAEALAGCIEIVMPSPEETVFGLCLDVFEI